MGDKERKESSVRFGQFLKSGRTNKDLRQDEVADMVGISRAYYCYLENGERNIDLDMAIKLCQVLGLDFSEFIKMYIQGNK